MLRVRDDDAEAFAELVELYQHRLVTVHAAPGRHAEEAEDLAQEVFLRVYRGRKKYHPRAKFSTWLFTIANHLALNILRQPAAQAGRAAECPRFRTARAPARRATGAGSRHGPHQRVQQQELAAIVRQALETLNERQRIAVVLNKFEDMNYAEIAEVMGLTTKAVKSLLSRARENLRLALKDYIEMEGEQPAASRAGHEDEEEAWSEHDPSATRRAELVAYLDGELDDRRTQALEAKLNRDPQRAPRRTRCGRRGACSIICRSPSRRPVSRIARWKGCAGTRVRLGPTPGGRVSWRRPARPGTCRLVALPLGFGSGAGWGHAHGGARAAEAPRSENGGLGPQLDAARGRGNGCTFPAMSWRRGGGAADRFRPTPNIHRSRSEEQARHDEWTLGATVLEGAGDEAAVARTAGRFSRHGADELRQRFPRSRCWRPRKRSV